LTLAAGSVSEHDHLKQVINSCWAMISHTAINSVVVKDFRLEDEDKDKDLMSKDEDLRFKGKDKDKEAEVAGE